MTDNLFRLPDDKTITYISNEKLQNICKVCNSHYYGWGNHPDYFDCLLSLKEQFTEQEQYINHLREEKQKLDNTITYRKQEIERLKQSLHDTQQELISCRVENELNYNAWQSSAQVLGEHIDIANEHIYILENQENDIRHYQTIVRLLLWIIKLIRRR